MTSSNGCGCGCGTDENKNNAQGLRIGSAPTSTTTEVGVSGMTCGHCVSSVSEELSELEGVNDVRVTLNSGGTSVVTISSTSALDPTAIRAAIDEAGYSVEHINA